MRLIRYTTDETPRVGVAVGEAIHPVEGTIAELLRLTAADMTARLQEAVRATDTVAMSDVRLLAPVDGWTEVWAAGVTYKRSREARACVTALGRLHQQVAERCDRVTLMVAGCALAVKGPT